MLRQLFALVFFLALGVSVGADDALRDVQIGMQGLAQAGSDPALLAQLMQDMQNPELMAEARTMMQDPKFVEQMKQLTQSKEFKASIQETTKKLQDPNTAAHAEAKMEHMLKVGQEQLKTGAAKGMEQAMAAMQDPAVLAEMTRMLKDPNFTKELKNMMENDPSFQNYVDAMQDMMKDPATKKKLNAFAESARRAL